MKRQNGKYALIIFLMIASLLWGDSLLAQSSTAYDLSWFTLSNGGRQQSTNFVIQDAIGQLAGDVSTSNNLKISGGFIQAGEGPIGEDQTVFLPLIIR